MSASNGPAQLRTSTTLAPPPYAGVIVVHSSTAIRTMVEQLVEAHPAGLPVIGGVATLAAAEALLSSGGSFIAAVENDIKPGGTIALIARATRRGVRGPVISLTDVGGVPSIPYGFCQAAARLGGTNHAFADALSAVLAGRTHLGADLLYEPPVISEAAVGDALTPREVHMLREVAFGHTSKQIAATHLVSSETVKTHLANAKRKLGASTRAFALDSEERPAFERLGIRAFLVVPIARDLNGDVIATICAFSSTPLARSLEPFQLELITDSAQLLSAMVPSDAAVPSVTRMQLSPSASAG